MSAQGSLSYGVNTTHSPRGSMTFSSCGRFRFRFTRTIGDDSRTCTFVLFNPCTASHLTNDPPIQRCMELARAWGYGELHVVHLFARHTSTVAELRTLAREPGYVDLEGARENQHYIAHSAIGSRCSGGIVVCAWGADGRLLDHDRRVLRILQQRGGIRPMALRLADGAPCAPLDTVGDVMPVFYTGRPA